MKNSRGKPAYDLDEVRRLVRNGEVRYRKRPRAFLENHYGCALNETALGVLESLETSDFKECVELKFKPGTYADVYRGGSFDDTEWYVKYFVDETGPQIVDIWTMVWDGAVH